jgi:hypothetical protein
MLAMMMDIGPTTEQQEWTVGDSLLTLGIARTSHGWMWRAKSPLLAEWCQHQRETNPSGWQPTPTDGELYVGPFFKNKRAATRDMQKFERDFMAFLKRKFPDLTVDDKKST